MIFQASMLLTDEWITLGQLEMEPFRQQLQGSGRRRDKRRSEEIGRIYTSSRVTRTSSMAASLTPYRICTAVSSRRPVSFLAPSRPP